MTRTGIIIVGAGGHASVVADVLLATGQPVLGFLDADASRLGARLCGLPILGGDAALAAEDRLALQLLNGIGGTRGERLRSEVQDRLEAEGWTFVGLRHPSAVVSPFAEVASCAQLMAASVVQPGAIIAKGCVVNSGAILEHDVDLGHFVHVAGNATLCGGVKVGAYSHVGAGAIIRQGVSLGEGTVVGAGAVVTRDYPNGGTLIGIPARSIGDRTP